MTLDYSSTYDYMVGTGQIHPMQTNDPAYGLLLDDFASTPVPGIYRDYCYICVDPEFAQMGLPLCYKCYACGGHCPADDQVCDACGADQYEEYLRSKGVQ